MIPRQFEPVLMGAVLSGLMSWVVSGVATLKAAGQVGNVSFAPGAFGLR